MPTTSRFNLAFSDWLRGDLDRFDRLWNPPEFGDKQIKLSLRRFAPNAIAYLDRNGTNVAVEWEYEVWDFLFADDLAAERSEAGGWRCGLCPPLAEEFATLELLWIDHLFEPLAEWLERMLMPAEALYLQRRGGCTWATLAPRSATPPGSAIFAIFAAAHEQD